MVRTSFRVGLGHAVDDAALARAAPHEVDDGVADVLLCCTSVAAMACRCEGVFVAQTPSTRLAARGAPGAAMAWGSYAVDAKAKKGRRHKYGRAVREVAHAEP